MKGVRGEVGRGGCAVWPRGSRVDWGVVGAGVRVSGGLTGG